MNVLRFNNEEGEHIHHCHSSREGDWIIFRCPKCADYERRINYKTGEMEVDQRPDNHFLHQGSHIPANLQMIKGVTAN